MDHEVIEWDDANSSDDVSHSVEESMHYIDDGHDHHGPETDQVVDFRENDPFLQHSTTSQTTTPAVSSVLSNIPVIELQHIPRITKRQFHRQDDSLLKKRQVIKALMRQLQKREAGDDDDIEIVELFESNTATSDPPPPAVHATLLTKEQRVQMNAQRRLEERKRALIEWRILVKGINKKRQALEDVVVTHLSTTPGTDDHVFVLEPTPHTANQRRTRRHKTHLDQPRNEG